MCHIFIISWSYAVKLLEEKNRTITTEKILYENRHHSSQKELEEYKLLNQTLKNRLKDLIHKQGNSEGNNKNNKEFLDSFEEVMQDEMMTMKAAFEAKLQAAKNAAEELSKKHAIEIVRIQSSTSPFPITNAKLQNISK